MISKVRIEDAIGLTLAHDVTKVISGGFKGPAFQRGHIIKVGDIPEFLRIGKEHVYVLKLEEGEVHEEEAALRIARAIAGTGLTNTEPREGRVNLVTSFTGLIKINETGLEKINSLGEIIIATLHSNTVCNKGMIVAGMRIIPLYIHKEKLDKIDEIAMKYQPIISLLPVKHSKIGLIITGNEVFKGTIKDEFSLVLHQKVEAFGCTVNNEAVVPDDSDIIAQTIKKFQTTGSEIIICSSGMSVDPDDATPEGIQKSGAKIFFYGLPVLPGAMFLYAKLGNTPLLGAPACVLHDSTTAFDKLFPIILTGENLTFKKTRKLGHGGLCLNCKQCTFPLCPFCM